MAKTKKAFPFFLLVLCVLGCSPAGGAEADIGPKDSKNSVKPEVPPAEKEKTTPYIPVLQPGPDAVVLPLEFVDEDGKKYRTESITYKDNNGNKYKKFVMKDGRGIRLSDSYEMNGKPVCTVDYYDTGEAKGLTTYDDANKTVRYMLFYLNGQKKYEWTLKDGKKYGTRTFWSEDGKKTNEDSFENGELVKKINYDEKERVKAILLIDKGDISQSTEYEYWPNGQKQLMRTRIIRDDKSVVSTVEWDEDGKEISRENNEFKIN